MQGERLPTHIEALLSPAVYHPVGRVESIQTHVCYVFLVGDYVDKVKKPVDMGFLDHATLEKRKLYCEEEVGLNRRLCSEAHLGVVAVSMQVGRVLLDGSGGEIIDYPFRMRHLPEEQVMERLLGENAVGSEMLALWHGGT